MSPFEVRKKTWEKRKSRSVSDEERKSLSRPVNVCTVCAHSFDETVFLPAPVLSR